MLKVYPFEKNVLLQYGHSSDRELTDLKNSEDFLSREDAEKAYKTSDLIFSHCGIGSIFNSLKYNRPTIILPRYKHHNEFSDDHQLQIAREISNNDLIFMVNEDGLNLDDFLNFVKENASKEKKEVDLTNYQLANFIKSRFYADE